MAHIVIAGRPNSEDTSECILIAENLNAHFPTVRYVKVLKHTEEWDFYSEKVCNLFGFMKITHPLIFYSNGRFIGDKNDFIKLIKTNFKIDLITADNKLDIESSVIKNLTQENIKTTNFEYFTRINGSKIRDKIDKKIDELSGEDYNNMTSLTRFSTIDSHYITTDLGDMDVYYKYHEKYLPRNGEYDKLQDYILTGTVEIMVEDDKTKKHVLDSEEMEATPEGEEGADNSFEKGKEPILKSKIFFLKF